MDGVFTEQSDVQGGEASVQGSVHDIAIEPFTAIHLVAKSREDMPQNLMPSSRHGRLKNKIYCIIAFKHTPCKPSCLSPSFILSVILVRVIGVMDK